MSLAKALRNEYPGITFGPGGDGADCVVVEHNGEQYIAEWNRQEPKPDEATLLAAYNPLPDAKIEKIEKIRAEAKSVIESKWPVWKQSNVALGVYEGTTCADDIASVITASNAAEDAVDAATTVQEVEAVSAIWPVI